MLLAVLMLAALSLPSSVQAQFRGDDDGNGIITYDTFEDGLQEGEYFIFNGGGAGIGLAESNDVPGESSGSIALEASVAGADGGGGFAGYGAGTDPSSTKSGIDVSGLGDTAYLTMYFKSDAQTEYTLEINLQEDQDGNGSYDGSGAVDDEFQFEYVVEPSASGYSLVSVPLSDFADDNAVRSGGDGQLSDRIANLVFAIGGLPDETFTFTVDDIAFTDDGSALPVELAGFDVRTDGNDALLSWQTLSETNNARFDVQVASGTDASFRTVGSVSGAGTTTETQRYRYRVSNLDPGMHRVRLRQVDLDGSATLLDARTVEVGVDGPLSVMQATSNPVRQGKTATLKYAVRDREPVRVTLYNVLGKRVRVLRDGQSTPGAVTTLRVPTGDLASGQYFLRIQGRSFSETESISVVR